ncbi:DUF4351 domain-containing protein [Algoriphagus marincola]|uniref:DUF4351 domain-containing protein n=1 Tax=Algoriphagus marincola TaxID=264027 RepID=A0ABS7MZ46_9BACT|nr:DUF4351 domain-containing protein [Algoriphagus marincola]MBY5949344.1 DUF4351 domain-containing protein [Algoriphagus marincola]
MRNILFILLILGFFSCQKERDKDIYLGKLDEIIVGDFSIKKDSLTKTIHNIRVVKDEENEFIVTTSSARQFKGWAFVFRSTETGEEDYRIEIPNEGPNSMKGGISGSIVSDFNTFFLIGSLGDIGRFDSLGNKLFQIKSEIEIPFSLDNMVKLEFRDGLSFFDSPFIQFGQNPSHPINLRDKPGPGEIRSEFSLDFTNWLTRVDVSSGKYFTSEFLIPEGYEKFQGDMTSTILFGAFDSKRGYYYLGWPYSNEIYVLEGIDLIRKIQPFTNFEFNFLPSEPLAVGQVFTAMVLPKEASENIFLLYDEHKDLILKCSKINDSGFGETKFERTKHYVLSIYSGEWEHLGEYLFDFESELDLENWFLTSEGLFINKPEQKSEDEYEFYKIDLSKFSN